MAENLNLKRIRLKSDPVNNQLPYEGYILKEYDNGTVDIMVVGGEVPTMNVAQDQIEEPCEISILDKFKLVVIDSIKEDSLCCEIKGLNSITDIENILISNGYSFEDLYCMMKKVFALS